MNATKTKYTDAREFTQFAEPSPLDYTNALVLDMYLEGYNRESIARVKQNGCYSHTVQHIMGWPLPALRTSGSPKGRCHNCGKAGSKTPFLPQCKAGHNANPFGIFHPCTDWEPKHD